MSFRLREAVLIQVEAKEGQRWGCLQLATYVINIYIIMTDLSIIIQFPSL